MMINRVMSKFTWGTVLAATIALAGLTGCGKKEIEQLRTQTASLEAQLTDARAQLEAVRKELEDAHTKDQQDQAKEEALTNELVKVKVERDKLKQELAALRRKH
jgi:outer membrane murein-binding lipoprotein Lpp